MSTVLITGCLRGLFYGPVSGDKAAEGLWVAFSDNALTGLIETGHTLHGDFSGFSHYPRVQNLSLGGREFTLCMERWNDSAESLREFLRHWAR